MIINSDFLNCTQDMALIDLNCQTPWMREVKFLGSSLTSPMRLTRLIMVYYYLHWRTAELEDQQLTGLRTIWITDFSVLCTHGTKSYQSQATCGVPQWSILGPHLFFIYVNDLHKVVKNAFLLLFADDNLFYTGNDIHGRHSRQNKWWLANLTEWLAYKLSLNIKKTTCMIFHSGYIAPGDINITIRNETIGRVHSTKIYVS